MNKELEKLTNEYIDKVKDLCSCLEYQNDKYQVSSLCDLSISNSQIYSYLKENYDKLSNDYVYNLVFKVLAYNNISWKRINLSSYIDKIYQLDDKKFLYPNRPRYEANELEDDELAIVLSTDKDIIYFFKQYGLQNQIHNKKLILKLSEYSQTKKLIYVNLVEKDAFTEVINHNNDINDPTRGTNVISVFDFIKKYCDVTSFKAFKSWCSLFTENSKEYFDFKIVTSLQNPNFYNFKRYLNTQIHNYDYELDFPSINKDQHKTIKNRFISSNLSECLTGTADFAISFMTSEWLYTSLGKSKNIDYTPMVMGYFKSIEQFLDLYISQFVDEIDPNTNKNYILYLKNNNKIPLTSKKFKHYRKDLTLGNLTNFFGYFDSKNNSYNYRNVSLLYSDIDTITFNEVIKLLSSLSRLRNGYFHKDNITNWVTVENARSVAFQTFYLMLGCYNLKANYKELFGFRIQDKTEFIKLCEFLESNKNQNTAFDFVVYHIDEYDAWMMPVFDDLKYDNNGVPIYKSLKFESVASNKKIISKIYNEHNLPTKINQGVLKISKQTPISFSIEDNDICIFNNKKLIINI